MHTTFLANTAFAGLGAVAARLSWLVAVIIIARVLGPDGFGLYTLAMAVIFLLSALLVSGVRTVTVRETARAAAGHADALADCCFAAHIVMGVVVGSVGAAVVWLAVAPGALRAALLLVIATVLVRSHMLFWFALFQGRENLRATAMLEGLGGLLYLAGVAALLFAFPCVQAVLTAMLAAFAMTACVAGIASWRKYGRVPVRWQMRGIAAILSEAWPIAVANLLSVGYRRLVTLYLGAFSTAAEIGYFGAGVSLTRNMLIVSYVTSSAALPTFARLASTGDGGGVSMRFVTKLSFFALIPMAVFLSIFGTQVVHLVYGSAYGPAALPLVIAGWSTICLVCVAPLRTYLAATGHQRFWMWLLVFAVGTVSVLGLYLVPRYSALGASITLAIGEAAMLLLGIIAIRLKTDALHVRDWRPVLRTAAKFSGALAFFIAVLLLLKPYGFIVAGAAGVLVYALALWWMNAFKPGEKASVWLLLSRLAGGRGRSAGPT